jgi:hypothetical protein
MRMAPAQERSKPHALLRLTRCTTVCGAWHSAKAAAGPSRGLRASRVDIEQSSAARNNSRPKRRCRRLHDAKVGGQRCKDVQAGGCAQPAASAPQRAGGVVRPSAAYGAALRPPVPRPSSPVTPGRLNADHIPGVAAGAAAGPGAGQDAGAAAPTSMDARSRSTVWKGAPASLGAGRLHVVQAQATEGTLQGAGDLKAGVLDAQVGGGDTHEAARPLALGCQSAVKHGHGHMVCLCHDGDKPGRHPNTSAPATGARCARFVLVACSFDAIGDAWRMQSAALLCVFNCRERHVRSTSINIQGRVSPSALLSHMPCSA